MNKGIKGIIGTAVGGVILAGAAAIFVGGEDATTFVCPPEYNRTTGQVPDATDATGNTLDITVCENDDFLVTARDISDREQEEINTRLVQPITRGGYVVTVQDKKTGEFKEALPTGFR